jgi:hypothetical protein
LDIHNQVANRKQEYGMQDLKVIWRNPQAPRNERRCVPLQIAPDRRVYLVEEKVTRGDRLYWSKAGALEVVYGGRRAA